MHKWLLLFMEKIPIRIALGNSGGSASGRRCRHTGPSGH